MEWYWIMAFSVGGVCLVGGIVWSILWRKREKKGLLDALVISIREEELVASRQASRRESHVTEGTSCDKDLQDSAGASCETLPSTSSKDRMRNNNEMEMRTFAGVKVTAEIKVTADVRLPSASSQTQESTIDEDDLNGNRASPTYSDWQDSTYPSGTTSPTIDTDYTATDITSSRPGTSSSDRAENISEIDSIPAVAFQDVPKRGSWKLKSKPWPQVAHKDIPGSDGRVITGSTKYERLEMNANQTPGIEVEGSVGQGQNGSQLFVPVQSSDSEDEFSTHL